jgi:hypothetical protein
MYIELNRPLAAILLRASEDDLMADLFNLPLLILIIVAECRRGKAEWHELGSKVQGPRRINRWLIILLAASPMHYALEVCHALHLVA